MNFWGFLSVAVIFGVSFAGFVIFLNHQKAMRQLDLEAMRAASDKPKKDVDTTA
ncbi:MAG TPA: hypothetical protein VIC26_15165 [Marinagarivorans sp.]